MHSTVERAFPRSLHCKNNGVIVETSWFGLDTGTGVHGCGGLGTEVISCDDTPKENFRIGTIAHRTGWTGAETRGDGASFCRLSAVVFSGGIAAQSGGAVLTKSR